MKISVTFRNKEGENWHKEYIEQKLKKVEKYMDTAVEARVVLSVEKFRNVAEVNLMTNGQNINAKEEAKPDGRLMIQKQLTHGLNPPF